MRDYYRILGISKESDIEKIKIAYKQKALKYHPDKSSDPRAKEKFQLVSDAYRVLSDPYKRRRYDSMFEQQNETNNISNLFTISNPFKMFDNFMNEINNINNIIPTASIKKTNENIHKSKTPINDIIKSNKSNISPISNLNMMRSFSSVQSSVINKNGERQVKQLFTQNNNGKTKKYNSEYIIDKNGNKKILKQDGNPSFFNKKNKLLK
jgi:DnaJ-class molecular chaperone